MLNVFVHIRPIFLQDLQQSVTRWPGLKQYGTFVEMQLAEREVRLIKQRGI
jgi:hypothetical protein